MNRPPTLWVWNGSILDRMDVLRYVRATDADIVNQPAVTQRHAALEARWQALREWAEGMLRRQALAAAFCRILLDYMQQLEREGGGG
ncbi:MAG TPA: hypothetical protein VM366_00085 [Anaerolineae bacterium]|nr:hypothetical protein [Anaerolineae bacterium]